MHYRRTALVTGAYGPIGRAVCRTLGATMELVVSGFSAQRLLEFVGDLRADGYMVAAAIPGHLADFAVLNELAAAIGRQGGLNALVNTADVRPDRGDWTKILSVNTIAVGRLLDSVEPVMRPSGAAVLLGSVDAARHLASTEALDVLLRIDKEMQLDAIRPFLFTDDARGAEAEAAASLTAYGLSKRAIARLCERRSARWKELGCRINTVSPGHIGCFAPDREAKVASQGVDQARGSVGTPMDVANAVAFLLGPQARFIHGADLRVDGGAYTS